MGLRSSARSGDSNSFTRPTDLASQESQCGRCVRPTWYRRRPDLRVRAETFASIVVIDSHRDAVSAARAFANGVSADPSLLLIVGSTGVGKTVLVQSMLDAVSARGHRSVHVMTARDMTSHMVQALRRNAFGQLSRRFGRSDFVAIEDVSDLRGMPGTLEELGRVIAGWVAAGTQVACTAACPLQELTAFQRRLPPAPTSRVIMLPDPTRSEMQAILKHLALSAGTTVDRCSLAALAAWCNGDIRRAVGAVQQLAFHAAVGANPSRTPARPA